MERVGRRSRRWWVVRRRSCTRKKLTKEERQSMRKGVLPRGSLSILKVSSGKR